MMNNMVVFMDKALMVFYHHDGTSFGRDRYFHSIYYVSFRMLYGCCVRGWPPIVPAMMVGLCWWAAALVSLTAFLLVTFPDLNSTIVTLGNQILFRGIAYMILEDKPITSISSKMSFLAWSKVAGIPLILIVFFVETLIFAFVDSQDKIRTFPCMPLEAMPKPAGFPV